MNTAEAKQYILQRKAELEQNGAVVNPLNFVNLMIHELWSKFRFSVYIDFTNIPIEKIFVNQKDGCPEYQIPSRFPLWQLFNGKVIAA